MKSKNPPDLVHRRLYPIKEAAGYMGFSPWTVRGLIWKGEIAHINVAGKYFLDITDMDRWIEINKTKFTF
ncbi:MAG: helix-turn-helix domain-containing protein [Syntrophorhabdales bacterium]